MDGSRFQSGLVGIAKYGSPRGDKCVDASYAARRYEIAFDVEW